MKVIKSPLSNSTAEPDKVTCKLCLRTMDLLEKNGNNLEESTCTLENAMRVASLLGVGKTFEDAVNTVYSSTPITPVNSTVPNDLSVTVIDNTTIDNVMDKLAPFTTEQLEKEVTRRKVSDHNYVPTLEEAVHHPKEFVDGMTEV